MRKTNLVAMALAMLVGFAGVASATSAADDPLVKALRAAVEANLTAYNAKNVDGVLSSIDTHSPDYATTKDALTEQFQNIGATAKLTDFRYIGHDDEFAVVRMKIALAGPPTSDFVDNVVDGMMVFHQENGTWKLWSEDVLGVEFTKFTPNK
jgi:hypothetical protein